MDTAKRLTAEIEQAGKSGSTVADLAASTGLAREIVLARLTAMQEAGDSVEASGRWYSPARSDWWTGVVLRLQRGDALLLTEPRGDAIMFLARRHLNGARDGDLVAVTPVGRHRGRGGRRDRDRLPEGKVGKVLHRAHQRIVGLVQSAESWAPVLPLDARIRLEIWLHQSGSQEDFLAAGTVVQVDLTERRHRGGTVGVLGKVLGSLDDPSADTPTVIATFDLPAEFSPATVSWAESLPDDPAAEDLQGREDLRDLPTMTIDGADAKDFDDAISIERRGGGYRLWVHIADVANYVELDSAADLDARERGTSVYFADRVLPMLPEAISNGLCSLRPNVERLTMSARLDFDAVGEMTARKIFPAVIRSNLRATYGKVEKFLQGEKVDGVSQTPQADQLQIADELLDLRLALRATRGALDLEIPESRVRVDREGKPTQIATIERLRAHRLIEEFMLAANEAVATELAMQELDCVHRVHPPPDPSAAEELAQSMVALGLEAPRDLEALHAKSLQELVETAEARGLAPVASRLILRSLQQAHYSIDAGGHFALALRHYTHFTSPIRRYPDLMVHRALRARWQGTDPLLSASQYKELAAHTSSTERRAEKAERELSLVKKLRWLQGREGEAMDGTVVGVGRIGLFVELSEAVVDGVVPATTFTDDRYRLEQDRLRWVGDGGRTFVVGDAVEVEIRAIDLAARRLDLALIEMPSAATDSHRGHGGNPAYGRTRRR